MSLDPEKRPENQFTQNTSEQVAKPKITKIPSLFSDPQSVENTPNTNETTLPTISPEFLAAIMLRLGLSDKKFAPPTGTIVNPFLTEKIIEKYPFPKITSTAKTINKPARRYPPQK